MEIINYKPPKKRLIVCSSCGIIENIFVSIYSLVEEFLKKTLCKWAGKNSLLKIIILSGARLIKTIICLHNHISDIRKPTICV